METVSCNPSACAQGLGRPRIVTCASSASRAAVRAASCTTSAAVRAAVRVSAAAIASPVAEKIAMPAASASAPVADVEQLADSTVVPYVGAAPTVIRAPPSQGPLLVLPGFSNASSDYTADYSLLAALRRRGFAADVLPIERRDWLKVARALLLFPREYVLELRELQHPGSSSDSRAAF